jgi:hypothetical protein
MEVRPTLVGGALVFGVVVLLAAPRTSAASAASGPELEVDQRGASRPRIGRGSPVTGSARTRSGCS